MSVHQVMADYAFDVRPLSMVSCQMHNLPLLDAIGVKPPTDERAGSVFVCLPTFVTCNRDKCGTK